MYMRKEFTQSHRKAETYTLVWEKLNGREKSCKKLTLLYNYSMKYLDINKKCWYGINVPESESWIKLLCIRH